jgi:ribonuclease HI
LIEIYTDGSYRPSTSKGGWAFVVVENEVCIFKDYGFMDENSSSQKAELFSAIRALDYCFSNHLDSKIKLYTDSKYLERGLNEWLEVWENNHWLNANYEEIKNVDYWEELSFLAKHFDLECVWIKGHSGNEWNELANSLAQYVSEF